MGNSAAPMGATSSREGPERAGSASLGAAVGRVGGGQDGGPRATQRMIRARRRRRRCATVGRRRLDGHRAGARATSASDRRASPSSRRGRGRQGPCISTSRTSSLRDAGRASDERDGFHARARLRGPGHLQLLAEVTPEFSTQPAQQLCAHQRSLAAQAFESSRSRSPRRRRPGLPASRRARSAPWRDRAHRDERD